MTRTSKTEWVYTCDKCGCTVTTSESMDKPDKWVLLTRIRTAGSSIEGTFAPMPYDTHYHLCNECDLRFLIWMETKMRSTD